MPRVGHNVGVTDAPTPPSRPARARAFFARAVDDAQFARPKLALTSLGLLCVMVLGGSLLPVPYVIERPGPALDVLGEYQDEQILTIEDAETYPTEGELMMTTVSVDGGPGYRVTPVEVITSWFDRSKQVLPKEAVFPEGQTREQTDLDNSAAMSGSQQGAVAVALDELGIEYEDVVQVAGVEKDGPADGTLEPGDVIVAVDGTQARDVARVRRLLEGRTPGKDIPLTVLRDGEEKELSVPTKDVDGAAKMGIVLVDGHEFPMDVDISVGDIGGPSAGLIFSLSVYDELTPGALTGGHSIAGTGTISEDGTVGPIGGIRQKLVGAKESGAEFFRAPADNCTEVVGYEPDGLQVVAVASFDEALTATETIASTGDTGTLPTCEDMTSK